MSKDRKFQDYIVTNIPIEVHTEMKKAAKAQRIPMRLWVINAIKEQLLKEK